MLYAIDLNGELTNEHMEQNPSREAKRFAASQEIPRILWNPKVHYLNHKSTPPIHILSQKQKWLWNESYETYRMSSFDCSFRILWILEVFTRHYVACCSYWHSLCTLFAFSLFDIQAVVPSSHLYLPCRAGWNNGKALGLCSRAIQLF